MAIVVQKRDLYTETRKQRVIYSDIPSSFSFDIESNNDLTPLTNAESVKQSIKNLLLTHRSERFFNPSLGSDMRHALFELASPAQESVLEDLITTTINNYEPRASLLDVSVSSDEDQHLIVATIVFSLINIEEPIVFDLILNRIR